MFLSTSAQLVKGGGSKKLWGKCCSNCATPPGWVAHSFLGAGGLHPRLASTWPFPCSLVLALFVVSATAVTPRLCRPETAGCTNPQTILESRPPFGLSPPLTISGALSAQAQTFLECWPPFFFTWEKTAAEGTNCDAVTASACILGSLRIICSFVSEKCVGNVHGTK